MHFQFPRGSRVRAALVAAAVLSLAACASGPRTAPPVEDRSLRNVAPGAMPATGPLVDPALMPGAENAGKPGYYTVRPGDTMIRIGLETGQNWRDIASWNGMDNANVIEVGQVMRVVPPLPDPAAVATQPVTSARVEPRPLDLRGTTPAPEAPASAAPVPAAPSAAAPVVLPTPAPTPPAVKDENDPGWAWPASGPVLAQYDEARTKGVVIGGKPGDAVLAAADGRVVYAGSGLRGYGNLVIVKHNPTYLSAYAHNRALLVKEDQPVRRGQQIAEMGSTDADRVQLHFEIRKLGKPVDPTRLLPPR
ncbi:MAG: peptidoglycan DD-metalloendopeptidase family protein [Methylibium sp.]|nr:peptidoglycan DD-metalloendopeptidase family protein [Methylibium sp.]